MDDELLPEAQHIERMFSTIERLRSERDSLRRDLEFVGVENKFKVEDLERRLTRTTTAQHSSSIQLSQAQRGAFVFILVSQYLQAQCETYRSDVRSLNAALEQLLEESEEAAATRGVTEARMEGLQREISDLRHDLTSSHTHQTEVESELLELKNRVAAAERLAEAGQSRISQLEDENQSLRGSLSSSRSASETAHSQASELIHRIASLEAGIRREKSAHQETGVVLAQAEDQVVQLNLTLSNTTSERDSLSLQITHLTQDLEGARHELHEAEAKFNALQTKQLSSMSSTDVTRALRKQIEDLEYRVLHRTEQIGIHQRDISRLETNMRLQDERIVEMTSDIEVLQGEKEAMIEDCRTTRAERDHALRRCEELEEQMEEIEGASVRADEQRSLELEAMVGLVFCSVAVRQHLSHQLRSSSLSHANHNAQLEIQLREADEFRRDAQQQIERLNQDHARATLLMEERLSELASLQQEKDTLLKQCEETFAALDVARTELRDAMSSLDRAHGSSQAEISQLRQQLQAKDTELSDLGLRYKSLCAQQNETTTTHSSQISNLEAQICSAQDAYAEVSSLQRKAEKTIQRLTEELQTYRARGAENALAQERLRAELEELQANHLSETSTLRAELSQARADVEETKHQHAAANAGHKLALESLTQVKRDLEVKLAEVSDNLQSSSSAQADLIELQDRYDSETNDLQERLDYVSHQLEAARQESKNYEVQSQVTISQLEQRLSEASDVLHEKEDLELEIGQLRTQQEAEVRSLERQLAIATDEVRTAREAQQGSESLCQILSQEKSDLEAQVARLTADLDQAQDQLKAVSVGHDLVAERHSAELQAAVEQLKNSQDTHGELAGQVTSLQSQLQKAEFAISALQEEKQNLQTCLTEVEADLQRSLSMQRYQENQLKDSEREALSTKAQLEQARANSVEFEKVAKAAEINLQLQSVQHEKTLSSLRREVESLRQNSKLGEAVAELKEQNKEMECLLQAKCLEIEENDDRVIELLKEKKKLGAKVESLTRKVSVLQAKQSAETHALPDVQRTAPSSSFSPPAPPVPPAAPGPSSSRPAAAFHTPSTPNSRRTTGGSSLLSRPQTPEVKVPPPPVFKARTPESKRAPPKPQPQVHFESHSAPSPLQLPTSSSSSASSLGKKRRAPDDFEDGEGLPPQGFTVDSVPSRDAESMSTTPRVRRALHVGRSGFTPKRANVPPSQPDHTALTSPARRATTSNSLIADVTNSPRGLSLGAEPSTKAGKKGWLGKIRAGPSNAPRSTSSRPVVFERVQNDNPSRR